MLNLDQNPTLDQLKALVASVDDTAASHVVYVDKTGNVKITTIDKTTGAPVKWFEAHEDEVQFRLETLLKGNGWLGPAAADDDAYMNELFEVLTKNWEEKNVGYIDEWVK